MDMKFYITKHCRERYIERILNGVVNVHDNLIKMILSDVYSAKNMTSQISTTNPRFILYIKERFGSDKGYQLLKKGDILFIGTKKKGTYNLYNIMTCYIDDGYLDSFKNTLLTNEEIHMKLKQL